MAHFTQEEIKNFWGGELPELEPEYLQLAEIFPPARKEIAPYVMKRLFSLEDARMVLALPATAAAIAKKFGMTEASATEKLTEMAVRGKIMQTDNGYEMMTNVALFKDSIFAQPKYALDYGPNFAELVTAWTAFNPDYPNSTGTFRVVPKWASIKDLPGVLPCENLPQAIMDMADQVVFSQCPCRTIKSIRTYGEYRPDATPRGPAEGYSAKDGVCLILGPRSDYYEKMYGAYRPTKEELKAKLDMLEQASSYYISSNYQAAPSMFCNCTDDCSCGARIPYDAGVEDCLSKSRFIPTLPDPEKCIGCGTCENACNFRTSIHVVDGKAVVDTEHCHGCGVCVIKCPVDALKMKLVRPASHIPKNGVSFIKKNF